MEIEIRHRHTRAVLYRSEDARNLREAVTRAVAERVDLRRACLYGACLYGANLYGANLRGADLYGADLRGANLRGANLYGAYLDGADLRGANLRGADLRGACLGGAHLRGAKIESGTVASAVGEGTTGPWYWRAWLMEDDSLVLRVGCHERPLEWWESSAGARCAEQENGNAARLKGLCAWVRALREASDGER